MEKVLAGDSVESERIFVKEKLCFTANTDYDDYFHQNFGKKLVASDSKAAYCGIFEAGPTVRVMVFAGADSGINSGNIAREVASVLGGSGGGDAKFAQGGGKDTSYEHMEFHMFFGTDMNRKHCRTHKEVSLGKWFSFS